MRDVEVKLVGPETSVARTSRSGLVFVENLTPGSYRVNVGRRKNPTEQLIEANVELAPDVVTPMATLGVRGPELATPVDAQPCCMPYGAPPSRRRVV